MDNDLRNVLMLGQYAQAPPQPAQVQQPPAHQPSTRSIPTI